MCEECKRLRHLIDKMLMFSATKEKLLNLMVAKQSIEQEIHKLQDEAKSLETELESLFKEVGYGSAT